METNDALSPDVLVIDAAGEIERICRAVQDIVFQKLRRRGAVLGLSGGIDSSVVAALCVRALGKDRVVGLFMPEADSLGESLRLGRVIADALGIVTVLEDITPMLQASGCYRRRDEAIRKVIPDYRADYKSKLVLPSVLQATGYPVFSVVVESPQGVRTKARLTAEAYLGIVAATNFKQRTRKMMEYYHADRLQYAVAGTPNRLEYDQGFFVKNGDGAADFKPIAHLYKTQVYQIARLLDIPEEIRSRPPTTDTYSLAQSQEEFYFTLPYDKMDLCLWGSNHSIPAARIAPAVGLTPAQVEQVYRDIAGKRRATRYLHMKPVLIDEVKEVEVD